MLSLLHHLYRNIFNSHFYSLLNNLQLLVLFFVFLRMTDIFFKYLDTQQLICNLARSCNDLESFAYITHSTFRRMMSPASGLEKCEPTEVLAWEPHQIVRCDSLLYNFFWFCWKNMLSIWQWITAAPIITFLSHYSKVIL